MKIKLTLHVKAGGIIRWFIISDSTSVKSSMSPSHSQSVGIVSSHWIIQQSLSSFGENNKTSGPSDSGSRSTSGDTGEGELRTGSIEVRVHC